ncbi:hypothetical protein [Streptomyces triticisoli]|uniref:hypothetical protein n=1 Tax=Streptomyces triticisoli TaxID=2182797 RepID=UPI000DD8BC48|nr:hypothetical protein [Streptomyces triticisoli]
MTTTPYTDEDLRVEAACQHATLTEDPDFMGVGEQMDDDIVASTENEDGGKTWSELLPFETDSGKAYNAVQRKIHALINGAADLSKWAVDLGADGLEPENHTLTVDGDGKPLVRLHCAFSPDLDDRARIAFMSGLARVMSNGL